MDARRAVLRVPTARQLYGVRGVNGREQESLERSFFTSIRLKNGTYKTTHGRRLDDLNDLVNRCLPRGRLLELMDVAVSSGITTITGRAGTTTATTTTIATFSSWASGPASSLARRASPSR